MIDLNSKTIGVGLFNQITKETLRPANQVILLYPIINANIKERKNFTTTLAA